MAVAGDVRPVDAEEARLRRPAAPPSPHRHIVLVVDDDDRVRDLGRSLRGQPLEVNGARDPAEALLIVGRLSPDLLIVGPVKARLDPSVLLEILREREPQLPVVVAVPLFSEGLAARVAPYDPAAVISYPYTADLLLRLVQSIMPTRPPIPVVPTPIDLGRLQIARNAPEITVDGAHQILPQREYLLLRFLAERVGHVARRDEITKAVWGAATQQTANTLAVHINRLRRRFGGAGEKGRDWIRAVRGVGYQLTVPHPPDACDSLNFGSAAEAQLS